MEKLIENVIGRMCFRTWQASEGDPRPYGAASFTFSCFEEELFSKSCWIIHPNRDLMICHRPSEPTR